MPLDVVQVRLRAATLPDDPMICLFRQLSLTLREGVPEV